MLEAPADKFLDVTLEPAQIQRDSLHDGAHQMSPCSARGLIEKGAARGRIFIGCQHAVNPWSKDQSVASGLHAPCKTVEVSVNVLRWRRRVVAGRKQQIFEKVQAASGCALLRTHH